MRAHVAWWSILLSGLLVQSTLFPLVFPDPWRPDVTRALVLWVALTGCPRGGALLAFAAGLALDAVSGAPLGFSAGLRLCVYGLARPLRGVFFDDRPSLILPLVALAAVVDAAGAGLVSWIAFPSHLSFHVLSATAWRQALTDAFWVPGVFVATELASGRRPLREVSA